MSVVVPNLSKPLKHWLAAGDSHRSIVIQRERNMVQAKAYIEDFQFMLSIPTDDPDTALDDLGKRIIKAARSVIDGPSNDGDE